jgi:serine/threonine protein kinase
MLPAQMSELRALFDRALDLPPIERAEFLRDLQFRSPLVYRELRSLLTAHDATSEIFESDGGIWKQVTPISYIGRRFGAYSIVKELGRGGMGAVFQATRADAAFHKTVAIKLVSGGPVLSDALMQSFLRERQILAQLEHPNIASLLDGGATEDGLLYLIMEYVDGLPLDQFVKSRNLPVEEILQLFVKVALAVAHAHRNLIVHRDLKPSNILVTQNGDVKLLDFGIAKVLHPDRDATATVAVRLTPEFASPEQIRGESVSTSSDVYSLGVLLFYILTGGARPYRPTSGAVPELLQSVLESQTPKPSSVAPVELRRRLQGDLDNIILKAMAKEAARRYVSVDQLREDIERHLARRPILARSDSWSYRASRFAYRHRFALGATSIVLLTLAGGALSTFNQAQIAEMERVKAVDARALAESQRRDAESQRQLALTAQQQAEAQRQLAERRTTEAQAERLRAEAERSSADSRYQSVRSLATTILFDVNESLRDLPGSAPARTMAILTALKHLEGLAAKSGNDNTLNEDLARAYEQSAEMMAKLFDDDPGAVSLDIPPLEKALSLRRRIGNPIPLAETYRLLGNSQLRASLSRQAIASYERSIATAKGAPASYPATRALLLGQSSLCTALATTRQFTQALPQCEQALELLSSIEGVRGPELQKLTALLHLRSGHLFRELQQASASIEHYAKATAAVNPLDAQFHPILEELTATLLKLPASATRNPVLAVALRKQGVVHAKAGRRDRSLDFFEQSLRAVESSEPPMAKVVAFAEASSLDAEANSYSQLGQVLKSIEASKKALSLLGESASGTASLLRAELEVRLRNFESAPAMPPR